MADELDADIAGADEVEADLAESADREPRPFEPPQWLKDRGLHSC